MSTHYERIKQTRKELKLTQQQAADALGMYRTTYVRYESGERELPMDIAIKIADYYQISLDYLVGRSDDKNIH